MLGVFRTQEGALMMIKPPSQARVGRVLEIDDGVDVAIEIRVFEELRGLVGQPGEREFGVGSEFRFAEAAKESRRCSSVETMIVVENSDPHRENPSACNNS